ncbi:MAG: hypothetical protein HUJ95_05390 [Bacteroidales bacterium]|nr:hypothetical protein [Bacteroidales bacterium]
MAKPNMIGRENENCWQKLRAAVVEQAATDYIRESRRYRRRESDEPNLNDPEVIRKWFLSDYFCMFSDISGAAILERLDEMIEEEDRKRYRRIDRRSDAE